MLSPSDGCQRLVADALFHIQKDNGAELTTLVSNQSTDAGSVSVSYPNGNWPEGKAFRINLVTSEDRREAILVSHDG